MLNSLFLKISLIILSFNILISASNDAPFGDILLHHVTNDQSHIYVPIEIGGIDLSIVTSIKPSSNEATSALAKIKSVSSREKPESEEKLI